MRFYLVKNHEINFPSQAQATPNGSFRREVTVPVKLTPLENGEHRLSNDDLVKLKSGLNTHVKCLPAANENSEIPQQTNTDWKLQVAVIMNTAATNYKDFIKVSGLGQRNFLNELRDFAGKHGIIATCKCEIINFTWTQTTNTANIAYNTAEHMVTNDVSLDEISSENDSGWGSRFYLFGYWNKAYWAPGNNCTFKGTLTITCTFQSNMIFLDLILSTIPNVETKKQCINRKILEEEMDPDAVIIASGDIPVKCHKLFLTVQSPVLKTMFKDTYEESKTNSVKMPDMTEAGVKALLAYLYYGGVEGPLQNCDIAVELLEAGHKYDIPELETKMKNILLSKPDFWYEVNESMRLFLFARNLPDGESLKTRAMKLLQLNFEELKNSANFGQLFREHPEAAKELCLYAFSQLEV